MRTTNRIHLERAIDFVKKEGSAVENARLVYLLNGEAPSPQAAAELLKGQREDGGWEPFWGPGYSSLDATCYRLAQADQMGLPASQTAIRAAARFLASRQRANGSWEEDERVKSIAPPWAQPGDLAARLYLTANLGFWLAALDPSSQEAVKAAGYLAGHLQDGKLASFLHTHWLAAGLWTFLGQPEPVNQVIPTLMTRLADMNASNLAWMCITFLRAGLRSDHPVISWALERLAAMQAEDGRWQSEDGTVFDVHTTLEALRAFLWPAEGS